LDGKLFGIGLKNALSLFVFFILLKVVAKVVLAQKPVNGLTEIVHAS
jgi:hypothetical protein